MRLNGECDSDFHAKRIVSSTSWEITDIVAVSQAKVRRELLELVPGHVVIADKLSSSRSCSRNTFEYVVPPKSVK